MSVEMLKLTGLSVVADELELTLYNTALLAESPSGMVCLHIAYDRAERKLYNRNCLSSQVCRIRAFVLFSEWPTIVWIAVRMGSNADSESTCSYCGHKFFMAHSLPQFLEWLRLLKIPRTRSDCVTNWTAQNGTMVRIPA